MKKLSAAILCSLYMPLSAWCQTLPALSLGEIYQKIETTYPEILKYNAKINAISAGAEGATSWMAPMVTVGIDRFPYKLKQVSMKNDPMNQAGIMIALEQAIPYRSELKAKQQYVSSLAEIQKNDAEWTKNILRGNSKLLYYQRYIAEKKIKVIEENLQLMELFIETAKERYKYNQADLSVIYKAQAQVADLSNMKVMLQGLISESNIGLNILMNRDINTPFAIDTAIAVKNYDSPVFTDTANVKRSDIAAVESSINAMALNRKYISLARKPDFSVKFQHMQMLGMPSQFSIMGMVTISSIPWAAKMYKSEVKAMGFEIQAMQQEKQTMQLMTLKMSAEKLSMLNYEKKQLENYTASIIPAYQKNLETTILAYKQNTGSFFILLDAWQMVFMKQFEALDKLDNILRLQAEYEFETQQL